MKKNVTVSNLPTVGMGGTIYYHSDREPVTVIQVLHNGKRIVLQEDKSIRVDLNDPFENQEYTYQLDPEGAIHHASLRKDGTYRLVNQKTVVSLGARRKYYDYSF